MSFDTSEGNQLSYFHSGYFDKILWLSHEPHITRKYAGKKEIISECFAINNSKSTFVTC